jgi:hypothetical protein
LKKILDQSSSGGSLLMTSQSYFKSLGWLCLVVAMASVISLAAHHGPGAILNALGALGRFEFGGTGRHGPREREGAGLELEFPRPLSPANTFIVTNVNDSGAGSLRQAILDANANPGTDLITFNIGSGLQTIAPASLLPDITDPVVIDGTSQPGFAGVPIIELSGVNQSNPINQGLISIQAGNSTLRGLIINHCGSFGILLATNGGNHIEGNFIGLDAAGAATTNSNGNGITISSSANNVIGGTTAHSGNVISGVRGHGISIFGNSNGNVIQGNYIGTNAAGTSALANSNSGINLGSSNNTVGGTTLAARNVISGNRDNGINLQGNGVSGNLIQGNYIGTDATGTSAIPNVTYGIAIFDINNNNTIGGTTPGAGNVVSGNGWGISIASGSSGSPSGNVVQGNYVGVTADGSAALSNRVEGVRLGGAINTIVGGATPGSGNIIAFNGPTAETGVGTGVEVLGGSNNSIRGNSIFSNGRLGIDLDGNGVTPNDTGDGDSGGNNRQNFPVITSVVSDSSQTTILGTLNSKPNTAFIIDFYSNAACDPSGNGEGARPFGLGTSITTDANGNATFGVAISQALPSGRALTATATDPAGNTSEFSACDSSKAGGSVQFSAASYQVIEDVGFTTITVTRSGGSLGMLAVDYATSDISATAGQDYVAASGTLTFADGEVSKTFNVAILDDSVYEPDEQIGLTLKSNSGLELLGSPSRAVLVLQDHTATPILSIDNVTINEGNSGTTNANFTVTLSPQTGRTVKVNYATFSGTATSGVDFLPVSGSLTFNPRVTTQAITVPVVGDTLDEPDETFRVQLTSAVNAQISFFDSGVGTIIDDDPPPNAIVQLSAATYNVTEGSPTVDITVNRSGDLSLASTVGYTTSDAAGANNCSVSNGAASSRCDYLLTAGTLSFTANESSKTISIPIVDDSYHEGSENFTFTLNNPFNVVLGSPASATVTITDNDAASGANPIDQSGFFVRQHYLDFLNRQPDTSGLNFWSHEIDGCSSQPCNDIKRINVSAAFYLSIEFQDTGYLVERIYRAAYGISNGGSTFGGPHQLQAPLVRLNEFLPDTQEISRGVIVNQGNWQQQLEANKRAFLAEFVQRSRFTTAFPDSTTAAGFVTKLNSNASGPLSTSELNQLISDLATNVKTRADVLRAIAEHPNLVNAEFNRAFVLMQYFGYLRRNPNDAPDVDYTGFDFWLTKLNQFNGNFVDAEMVKAFITSGEYRQRFGP